MFTRGCSINGQNSWRVVRSSYLVGFFFLFLVLITSLCARTKIQLLITDSVCLSTTENLDAIKTLSDLATSIFYTAKSVEIDICSENGRLMLFFNALFHQCQITLHSIIVPLFSGTSIDESICRETVRKSAESVMSHAQSFESLLAPYLYKKVDATHLPPLVGYGAFITAMVLLATKVSCQNKMPVEAVTGRHSESRKLSAVEAILDLLDSLRGYWKALQHPVSKVSVKY